MLRQHGLLAITLGITAACGGTEAPLGFHSYDSAGITVIVNDAPAWTPATSWKLSDEPILSIGTFDGPEEYQLFRVRGAIRLANGGIVIANGGTNELRFYDAGGAHLRTVGGEGGGPGEYTGLGGGWRLGPDSLVLTDLRAARLTVLSTDGQFGRTLNLPQAPGGGRPQPLGVFLDGGLLMSATVRVDGDLPEGTRTDTVEYLRYTSSGELLGKLATHPGRTRTLARLGDDGIAIMSVPYSPTPTVAVAHEQWFFGYGDRYEILRYSQEGTLTHLYRRTIPNRPVTQDMIDAFRAPRPNSNMPSRFARMRASIDLPETMPAFRSLQHSDDGTLWVQHYTLPEEQPGYAVFDADGRFLGDIETPIDARVLDIGETFALLVWEDDLEVEHVQLYEVVKP